MNSTQPVCNYALPRFLPYREAEEFVNVGVVVNGIQPSFLDFKMDGPKISERVKAFFPQLNEERFEAAQAAMSGEITRVKALIAQTRDPKGAQIVFNELVRRRESVFRFSEVRTILHSDPASLADELFDRYVRGGGSATRTEALTHARNPAQ